MDTFVVVCSRIGNRGLTRVSQIIHHLQLRLRAVEVGRDPATKTWTADMRKRVANGEVNELLASQPDDPRDLIDRRRSAAS